MLAQISEYAPPVGISEWMANLMYFAVFVAAIVHTIRSLRANPSLTEQIEKLKDWTSHYFTSRTRHDALAKSGDERHAENLDRFDAVTKSVDDLREDVDKKLAEMQKQATDGRRHLHDRIEEVPSKVIDLLGRTKGLL